MTLFVAVTLSWKIVQHLKKNVPHNFRKKKTLKKE